MNHNKKNDKRKTKQNAAQQQTKRDDDETKSLKSPHQNVDFKRFEQGEQTHAHSDALRLW